MVYAGSEVDSEGEHLVLLLQINNQSDQPFLPVQEQPQCERNDTQLREVGGILVHIGQDLAEKHTCMSCSGRQGVCQPCRGDRVKRRARGRTEHDWTSGGCS